MKTISLLRQVLLVATMVISLGSIGAVTNVDAADRYAGYTNPHGVHWWFDDQSIRWEGKELVVKFRTDVFDARHPYSICRFRVNSAGELYYKVDSRGWVREYPRDDNAYWSFYHTVYNYQSTL